MPINLYSSSKSPSLIKITYVVYILPHYPEEASQDVSRLHQSEGDLHPEPSLGLRHSTRANKCQSSSTRYINAVFLAAMVLLHNLTDYDTALYCQAELETNMGTF